MALIDNIKHNNKPTRYYSKKQERYTANLLKGSTTKNSGASLFEKGDVHSELFQIECKTQEQHKESFSIKKKWLDKNLQETLITGKKYAALAFNFGPDEKNYYVVDENTFLDMVNALKKE